MKESYFEFSSNGVPNYTNNVISTYKKNRNGEKRLIRF